MRLFASFVFPESECSSECAPRRYLLLALTARAFIFACADRPRVVFVFTCANAQQIPSARYYCCFWNAIAIRIFARFALIVRILICVLPDRPHVYFLLR